MTTKVDHKNIIFHDGTLKTKLRCARSADHKAEREYEELDYIDLEWMKQVINGQKGLCAKCSKVLRLKTLTAKERANRNPHLCKRDADLFTIKRIDHNQAYTKNNCYIVCFQCL